MSVVYKVSDVINIQIDKTVFGISPLNYLVKVDMQNLIMQGKPMDAAILALKNCVKTVKGLKNQDGSDYVLEKDENGILTEATINDLLNIPEQTKLSTVAVSLIHGMPQGEFADPQTGENLEGVKFLDRKQTRKK